MAAQNSILPREPGKPHKQSPPSPFSHLFSTSKQHLSPADSPFLNIDSHCHSPPTTFPGLLT